MDRAALDVSLERGYPIGGWCPRDRIAEDGVISGDYPLKETPERDHRQRTEWNVRDSDGTIILTPGDVHSPGTELTRTMAHQYRRNCLTLDPLASGAPEEAALWIAANEVAVLNVAGPRESERPGIGLHAATFMHRLLERLQSE